MKHPKTITINYQPLKTAEGTPHVYISVDHLKEWIKDEDAKLEYAGILRKAELEQFIEQ